MQELAANRPKGFGFTASPQEVEKETVEALREAKRSSPRRRRTSWTPTGSS